MFEYRYAYLIGDVLIFFPIWLALFLHRKDLRREILTMSSVVAVVGVLSEFWFLRDYWRPETFTGWPIGPEDFLFGFFLGGITSVIYTEVFNQHFSTKYDRRHHWKFFALPILGIFLLVLNLLIFGLGLNSIYASMAGFFAVSLVVIGFRHDLLMDSIWSGLLVGGVMLAVYVVFLWLFPSAIHRWWYLHNISGILVLGIPVEELVWAFFWGLFAGPSYEFLRGLRLKKG